MARPHTGYLYRRSSSGPWWIRFQYPKAMSRRTVQRSLGTTDRREAELKALPLIQQHKRDLFQHYTGITRHLRVTSITTRYPVGESTLPDGTQVIATDISAVLIKGDRVVGREDNYVLNLQDITHSFDPDADRRIKPKPAPAPAVSKEDPDLPLLERFLALKTRNPHYNAEARRTWEEFKAFVGGRTLDQCTRADGDAFVAHLRTRPQRPLKDATIIKVINYLKAPICHGLPRHDPRQDIFYKVTSGVNDALDRIDFDDKDMKLMRDHVLPKLDPDEHLMWVFLATTGMNHAEVFSIREEFEEGGIRYVRVGSKTEARKRKVPLPDCLLPHLPNRITGPLFADPSLKNISKNLMRAVRRAGITDARKVTYSLRHRAHTRLREVECPDDIQREIVGHETGEDHVGYGQFPLRKLKHWIDQIGY